MLLSLTSDKKIKEKIKKQDDLKLEFKRKLENIKQKYGIDFDIELLDTNTLDKIKFYNLKYKNKVRNVSLIYYNEYNYYGAYIYTVNNNLSMKDESYLTKKNYFNKQYKLELVINEIKQAHEIYKSKMLELETETQELSPNNLELEKDLKKPINPNN